MDPIVKGRLRTAFKFWRDIGANPDVLDVISNGYRLPFCQTPPSACFKNNKSARVHDSFVLDAITKLRIKNLIIESDSPPFVVNPLSVAVQSSGKLRLILDLRYINQYLCKDKIKFEDWNDALNYFQQGDFIFSFDLKSGYHHIDIFQDHIKYLGFSWVVEGVLKYFSFTVLPFGLSTAPYIFTKCLRPLVKHWRNKGIYIVVYLDDGWGREATSDKCKVVSHKVKQDLLAAGLVPNKEKSVWVPTQELDWLGMTWNARDGSLKITKRRISDMLCSINKVLFELPRVTARKLASVTGKIVSIYPVVGNIAQLKSRALHVEIISRDKWDRVFLLGKDSRAVGELRFWLSELSDLNIRLLSDYSIPQVLLYSDASQTGCGAWGVVCDRMEFHQDWTDEERGKSSTWRELKGVSLAVSAFAPNLSGKTVKICTDNKGVVSIVTKGSMVQELHDISLNLFEFCKYQNIVLTVQWIPRDENVQADLLSREVDYDDWGVSSQFFQFMNSLWGPHSVDRFADNRNTKLPVFNSRYWCPYTSHVDAFSTSWSGPNNWLVPPINMVSKVLRHVKASGAQGTLVIPEWPSAVFWPLLFAIDSPYHSLIRDVIRFNDPRFIFTQGLNTNSIFGTPRMQSAVLCVRLHGH